MLGWSWQRRAVRVYFFQRVPHGIFRAANGVLNFAFSFVRAALGLCLRVTGYLANGFLHRAFGLFRGAFDPVFIHGRVLLVIP